MITVIVTTLVLMAAGGLIAYLGDRWGYQLGKKRLSLFGLRPRRTASLLTVFAGVAIALMVFLVLLGVDAGFRVALVHGARQLHTIHLQKREIRTLTAQAQDRQQEAARYKQEAQQAQTQGQVAAARADQFAAANKREQQKLAATEAQEAAAQSRLQVLGARLASAKEDLGVEQGQVRMARAEARDWQQKTQIAREEYAQANVAASERTVNPPIYATGAEVGRFVIAAAEPQSAIRQDIVEALNVLSLKARKLGAAIGRNGRAVEVASIRFGSSNTFAQESDSINALAGQIHARRFGSVVVIAYASGNAFARRPVDIFLKPYSNPIVIPAGTVLGQTLIPDQQKGVAEILARMESFLKGPVHQSALLAGVIPVVPQGDIGDVYPQEIDPAVQKIQQIKGDVVVVASAARDTRAADQVDIHLNVYSAANQSAYAPGNDDWAKGRAMSAADDMPPAQEPAPRSRPALVLAVDPGSGKCGLALVSCPPLAVRARAIVPVAGLVDEVRRLLPGEPDFCFVVGGGTGSGPVAALLQAAYPHRPLHVVDEFESSRRARARYCRENPASGWRRLLPAGLRAPEAPYDDYVAVILAEDFLATAV